MDSYLHPLRRKIGVATLLVTCVFVAGWVRSLHTVDLVRLYGDRAFMSGGGYFFVSRQVSGRFVTSNPVIHYSIRWYAANIPARWQSWQVTTAEIFPTVGNENRWTFIPAYWSIVTPLILLSAWLLLSKPKTRKRILTRTAPPLYSSS